MSYTSISVPFFKYVFEALKLLQQTAYTVLPAVFNNFLTHNYTHYVFLHTFIAYNVL